MAAHFQSTFSFAGFKCTTKTWNCMTEPRVNATRFPNVHMQEVSAGSVYGAGPQLNDRTSLASYQQSLNSQKSNCLVGGQCYDLFSSG